MIGLPPTPKILGNHIGTEFWIIECDQIHELKVLIDFSNNHRHGKLKRVGNEVTPKLVQQNLAVVCDGFFRRKLLPGIPDLGN